MGMIKFYLELMYNHVGASFKGGDMKDLTKDELIQIALFLFALFFHITLLAAVHFVWAGV